MKKIITLALKKNIPSPSFPNGKKKKKNKYSNSNPAKSKTSSATNRNWTNPNSVRWTARGIAKMKKGQN
jgi:hypothetical protein